ncbi:alpha/beta fold hydrolase [Kribbella kalugense]|uniref:Pimeloyl-ACP methyl ester carboxylesterase n=1 Tax=Kribbella kalugense TaxID=2512221 RepID=A0A4R7ZWF7_9ACTN|nr:alpha/beta hydrolase [Kribbella kalugense]TDW22419.1 pimeloyl-ACP methyl ester carboxylesterase [Kribbella kalugense]
MTTINVPGAVLHYQLEGSGPLLLISQSGEGDADRTTDLAGHLTDRYTVLTYDRRGLSRSRLDNPAGGATIADHADDVHRLLAHLTDEPVAMLGCSLGAVIGLHVAVDHPGQLRTLVAHEPIAPWLLADAKRHRDELTEIRDHYLANGLQATIPEIVRSLGIDPSTGEPKRTDFPMDANRIANFDYFIRHDFLAAAHDDLDFTTADARIIPAAGTTTPHTVFDYQCAEALAALLDQELELFPGGHNGNLSHPKAYAHRLIEVLSR